MVRKKKSDDFSFKNQKSIEPVKSLSNIIGADNTKQLLDPLPFNRRFRPATGTKDFSLLSEYNYASLWARWRRGYELAMYGQQAFVGLEYSFKFYVSQKPGIGVYLPGMCFMYPTTRSDMRMWMVAIRPRDSFNFLDFGYAITAVTQYDANTLAVRLNSRFGAPVSFFSGEVLSNRFNADGTEKQFGYNNYTVTAVGFNDVPLTPAFAPIFNTLFLSTSAENSWSVVNSTTLAVPATGPPAIGEYLTTEMRYQCTCPDFLGREGFNLYEHSLKRKYPFTRVQNYDRGTYDAGYGRSPRDVSGRDDPGYVRDFGFIYINEIYNIPNNSDDVYSDLNFYYYQPKWCKHIYAAFWDMRYKYNQTNTTSPWLPQPSDEPLNEWYREYFDKELKKQTEFLKREKDLVWWQRYSPAKDDMPVHMMYPDMYNMMQKTLNFGTGVTPLTASGFDMFTVNEFDPFAPAAAGAGASAIYDGGTYSDGVLISGSVNTLDAGQYSDGVRIVASGYVQSINGGTYT